MDTRIAVRHWENWFPEDRESFELTSAEQQFIAAAIGSVPRNWEGDPDLGRMDEILAAEPAVLDRIGSILLHRLLLSRRGCGPAVRILLKAGKGLCRSINCFTNFQVEVRRSGFSRSNAAN